MNILVVEDDLIWQSKFEEILTELDLCEVNFASNFIEAENIIKTNVPDLIIADIIIGDELIFNFLNKFNENKIPILFVTASTNIEYYNLSKSFPEAMFLVKPFHALSVKAAIDKLSIHINNKIEKSSLGVFVRGIYNEKIFLKPENILYIKSEWNYCVIKTHKNQFAQKTNLKILTNQLGNTMIRIHRTYMVNSKYIQKVNLSTMKIKIDDNLLPIGRSYRKNIENHLNNIREL